MLVNRYNILKKPYVPPILEFEEVEELMDGDNVATGSVEQWQSGEGEVVGPREPKPTTGSALDLDFTLDMDFVINDEPQL